MWKDEHKRKVIRDVFIAIVLVAILALLVMALLDIRERTEAEDAALTSVQFQQREEEDVKAVVEVVTQAIESLASVVPEGVTVRSFCYAASAGEITLKIADASEVTVLAFLNGEWVEIEVIDNGDGTYTLNLDEACPIAILTK